MTPNTRKLLLVAALLLAIQWGLVPLFQWQTQRIETISRHADTLAVRDSLVAQKPDLDLQIEKRRQALSVLAEATFPKTATATVDLQRWLSKSLEEQSLQVRSVEWSPQVTGALSPARAKVQLRGSSSGFFAWIAQLQAEQLWVDVVSFRLRQSDRRDPSTDVFSGEVTLEFVLSESDNA